MNILKCYLNSTVNNPPYINLNSIAFYEEEINKILSDQYIKIIDPDLEIYKGDDLEPINTLNYDNDKELPNNINIIQRSIVKSKIKLLIDILSNYSFYNKSADFKKLKEASERNFKEVGDSNIPYIPLSDMLKKMIIEIQNNNLITLIGSLETVDHYQNIAYVQNTCSYTRDLPKEYYKIKKKLKNYLRIFLISNILFHYKS